MAGISPVSAVPPGQYAPFATVTEDDHRAWIIIAAAMGIAFALVTLLTRVLSRRLVNIGWALDDSVAAVATAFFFIQSSLVLGASACGLGKSINLIPTSQHSRVQQLYYASNIFYIFALDLAKLASILFFRRLTSPKSKLRNYSNILMAILPLSTVAFVLATALQCDLMQPWIVLGEKCPGWIVRWDVQGAISSLLEVAIFAGPVWLTWHLQRPLETKIQVATPFALRLIQSGLTIDPTLFEARYIYWTQIELSYGIIAATFPPARRLAVDLITYYNGGSLSAPDPASSWTGDTPRVTSLRPSKNSQTSSAGKKTTAPQEDSNENASQEMIIRKDFTVEVEHTSRDPNQGAREFGIGSSAKVSHPG